MQSTLQYFIFVSKGPTLFVVCLYIRVYLLFFVNGQMCELIYSHTCVIILRIGVDGCDYVYLAGYYELMSNESL